MNCYILVGGASSRMGRSKVELFLDRVVAAAVPVFDRVFAVQRAGGESANIETIFENAHELQAPAFGVQCALAHAAAPAFILAVDYPLVTSEVLRYIERRFTASKAHLVAPRWNGKLQMLCAAYGHEIGQRLEQRIADGRLDLRGLADGAEIIEEPEMRALFPGEPLINVNTPEELDKLP
jgi:molybdopterin-guanine dinucleotide biosynthesis protein A